MATGSEEVRVPISLPVETNAGQAADTVDQLSQRIQQSRDAFKDAATAMRGLKGSSDEVKAAKDQLKATMDREKTAISDATLALLKQGTSYDKVAAKAKDSAKDQKASTEATSRAVDVLGGRASALASRWEGLKKLLGDASGINVAKVALLGVAAAAVAATAAVLGGVIALGKWALGSADVARSMQLTREAVTSSAEDAQRLGNQVDALAAKVPLAKGQINDLAVALRRSGIQGQTLVDTLNASAQAASALGDQAGAKIDEIIKRGRITGRTFIGRFELQGTGIDYDQVAKNLAAQTGKGVDGAKKALMQGQVSIGAAAAALRKTVEDRFGEINVQKMFSFEGLEETWKKITSTLTKGINLAPLAKGLQQIMHLFDANSVTGQVLHKTVVGIGQGLVDGFAKAAPLIEGFVDGMIIAGLQIEIAYYKVRNTIRNAFGGSDILKNFDAMQAAITAGKVAVYALAAGFALAAVSAAIFFAPIVAIGAAIYGLVVAGETAWNYLSGIKWGDLATSMIDGLVGGITSGGKAFIDAIENLAGSAVDAFKTKLGIHSPSTVFDAMGQNMAQGAAGGTRKGTPDVEEAAAAMGGAAAGAYGGSAAPPASPATSGIGLGGGGGAQVQVTISIDARGSTPEAVDKMPDVVKPFVRQLEEIFLGQGSPTNA